MKRLVPLFTVLALLVSFYNTAYAQLDSIIIKPNALTAYEANISSVYPASVDTTNNSLVVARWTSGGSPHTWRTYVKYDLSSLPPVTSIVSAYFYLYADSISGYGSPGNPTFGSANASTIYRVTTPWTRTTISWNNQPSTTTTNSVSIPQSTNYKQNYSLNITNMLLDWLSSGNYGCQIRHVQEVNYYNSMIFCSSRHSDTSKRPFLKVYYIADTAAYFSQPLTKTSFCPGDTFHVKYSVNKPFNTGNIFNVELSNATGGFTFPVVVGSVSANTSGTIICTVPPGTAPGTGYRVRIVSNSPVRVSGNNGVNLTVKQMPGTSISGNSPVCEGDTIKLFTTGASGASHNWTGPASFTATGSSVNRLNATTAMAGTYTVINDLNGCKDTVSLGVTVKPAPIPSVVSNTPLCKGDTLHMSVTSVPAAGSYSWTGPAGFTSTSASVAVNNVTGNNAGIYTVTAQLNGCSRSANVNVAVTDISTVLGNDTSFCMGGSKTIVLNMPGATYLWQDGSTGSSYTISTAGKYYVTATLNGCKSADTINVSVINIAFNLGNDTVMCEGNSLTLQAPDTFDSYLWNTQATTPSISVNSKGWYWLTAHDGICTATDSIYVQYANPYFKLGNDTTVCNGTELKLFAASMPNTTYTWQDLTSTPEYYVKHQGIYWVKASTTCGVYSDTIKVLYRDCHCDPIVPNAFTPNGDGRNDLFGPIMKCTPTAYYMKIVNRWGNVVFESKNTSDRWDGTYKGKPQDPDTYFYYFEVKDIYGNTTSYKGNFILVK